MRHPAAAPASLLPAAHPLHLLVTLRLRIARGEQLGLVVGLASVSPAAFEILAVKSYGAVHCLNRILDDDDDPRYVSTGDIILEANGRTHPAAMIHELLCSRCISLTLAKPRRADVASAVAAPLSEVGSCGEAPTVFTPRELFSATPESPRSVSDEIFEPVSSDVLYSDSAAHCFSRILDDDDPKYLSTEDFFLEANGRRHPTAMIHELLCSRCISLTLAKPRRADVASAVAAPLTELGSWDESLTVFTPRQLFSATPESPRSVSDGILEPTSSGIFYCDSY